MSLSPDIAVPETQSSTDFVDFQFEAPAASLPIEESGGLQTDSAREQTSGKNHLPLFLIMAGFGVYFTAIAAFASFPGVAVGVFVMVLGAIVYTCRGLKRPAYKCQTAVGDASPSADTVTITPNSFGGLVENEFAVPEECLPETAEETVVNTNRVPAAV